LWDVPLDTKARSTQTIGKKENIPCVLFQTPIDFALTLLMIN